MHTGRWHAQVYQLLPHREYHLFRSADKRFVCVCYVHQALAELRTLRRIYTPAEQWYIHILPAQHMKQAQPEHVLVLQRLYILAEYDTVAGTIAIYQRKAAVRLILQHRLHNTHYWRYTAACRKGQVLFMFLFCFLRGKVAHRRHHIQHITRLQRTMCIGREFALFHLLYRYPQLTFIRAGADRIRAAYLRIIKVPAKRQVLTRGKHEFIGKISRYFQRYRHTISSFRTYILNLQGVKF